MIYKAEDVKLTWGQTVHEDSCSTKTPSTYWKEASQFEFAIWVGDYEYFAGKMKTINHPISDTVGYHKVVDGQWDEMLCKHSYAFGEDRYYLLNPQFNQAEFDKASKCDCNPTQNEIDLSHGLVNDSFIAIERKEENNYER